MGCCGNQVEQENHFSAATKGKKFYNAEMRCDFAGNVLLGKIDSGELTVQEVIQHIVDFARRVKNQKDCYMLSWFCMHLALGFCFHTKIQDRDYVREILKEILPYSRGIDNGVFYRDIAALTEEGMTLTPDQKELLEKAMYYYNMVGGWKINLREDQFGQKIFGPTYVVKQDYMYYIDLPIGNPAYSQGTAAASKANPLMHAVENLMPHVVLVLLRHGATAHGPVLNYAMSQLSSVRAVEDAKKSKVRDSPINCSKQILRYLLRTVYQLKLRFDDQRIGEMDVEENVYFTSERVKFFVPEEYYAHPNKLKQLCRCQIRRRLLDAEQMPHGIEKLPKLITSTKRYIDLLA